MGVRIFLDFGVPKLFPKLFPYSNHLNNPILHVCPCACWILKSKATTHYNNVCENTSKSFTCHGLSDFVYCASYQAPLSLCKQRQPEIVVHNLG
jgi:hypothetical protein